MREKEWVWKRGREILKEKALRTPRILTIKFIHQFEYRKSGKHKSQK